MKEVTDKQRQVIEYIRENTGIIFNGSTCQEARTFISEHIAQSKMAKRSKRKSANHASTSNNWCHSTISEQRNGRSWFDEQGTEFWKDEYGNDYHRPDGEKGYYVDFGGPCGPLYVDEFGET